MRTSVHTSPTSSWAPRARQTSSGSAGISVGVVPVDESSTPLRTAYACSGPRWSDPTPSGLHDRVITVLSEEWADEKTTRGRAPAPRGWRIAVAASISLAVLAATFGLIQLGRAREEARDAASFRTVLATLGGTGFKVGTLQPATHTPVAGSVVAYESSHDQSFVVVFVRTPHLNGRGSLLVSRSDGTTWDPGPIDFEGDGDAAVWWVTDRSIESMSGLTIRAPDGSTLATAGLRPA